VYTINVSAYSTFGDRDPKLLSVISESVPARPTTITSK